MAAEESGFTLIELLMVVAIIGIIASIALSAFLSKRINAGDASAKALVNSAQQAAVNYGLASTGYTGMTASALHSLEPRINVTANGQTVLATASGTPNTYTLSVVSSTANTFNLAYANGIASRTCVVASGNGNTSTNTGGGCKNGGW
jgi:prepilin-type N-terminal cleavage/methylation domain-containing protein